MDVKSTSTITKTKETSSASSSSSNATSKDSQTTFKDELDAVKTQEAKESEKQKTSEADNAKKNEDITKTQAKNEKDKAEENSGNAKLQNPLSELNSKIAAINEIKNIYNSKTHGIDSKTDDKTSDKNSYCQRIKMDTNDITFFINLVDNQQMTAQNNQANNSNGLNNNFTNIKSEATQGTVSISATLMDAINDSLKTNKPFRIDFDNDVAVIMKVDREGVLSTNFIPGSAAVEQYLKNNIETLKQNFDNQNLPYNELSYRQQDREREQEQQQNKNKENKNE